VKLESCRAVDMFPNHQKTSVFARLLMAWANRQIIEGVTHSAVANDRNARWRELCSNQLGCLGYECGIRRPDSVEVL
jgi:hypothetical protein